jgi:hypothetical protein
VIYDLHMHMIVPGGGLAPDRSRWISCKPNFLLPVRVLSKLFRRLMLEKLVAAHEGLVSPQWCLMPRDRASEAAGAFWGTIGRRRYRWVKACHAVGVYTLDSIFLSCTHSSKHFAPVAYELSWLNFDACSLRLGEQLA